MVEMYSADVPFVDNFSGFQRLQCVAFLTSGVLMFANRVFQDVGPNRVKLTAGRQLDISLFINQFNHQSCTVAKDFCFYQL